MIFNDYYFVRKFDFPALYSRFIMDAELMFATQVPFDAFNAMWRQNKNRFAARN